MARDNPKRVILVVVLVATLSVVLFIALDRDNTGQLVAGMNANLQTDDRQGGEPLELDSGRGNRAAGDPAARNADVAPREYSGPKQNTPVEVAKPTPTRHPTWSPIEQLPDLDHVLYVTPRWSEEVAPQTTPLFQDEYFANFAESGEGRRKGDKYHPRTNADGAVDIVVCFRPDAPDGTNASKKPIEWVEVASSLTGQRWKLAPQPKNGRLYHRLEIMVPLIDRDVLVVRAKQLEGSVGEALVTRMGLGWEDWPNRHRLNDNGNVTLHLWPLDTLESYLSCALAVTDASGNPAADTLVLSGGNVLGRTDGAGRIEFKVPEPSGLHPDVITVWKAGYVPMFVERSELAAANWDLSVTLKARELLAMIPEAPVPTENLVRHQSIVMHAGNDLIPIPDDMQLDWESFLVNLKGRSGLELPRDVAFGESSLDSKLGFPQGLERALGTKRRDHWPKTYGRWYHNRWQYSNGNYEVCLPYAGKFVLLLGEEVGGHRLTHVLFIDALDPENPTGRLLKRPGF